MKRLRHWYFWVRGLTLIWVGFLGVRLEIGGGGGGKITSPCLKLVRIMPET